MLEPVSLKGNNLWHAKSRQGEIWSVTLHCVRPGKIGREEMCNLADSRGPLVPACRIQSNSWACAVMTGIASCAGLLMPETYKTVFYIKEVKLWASRYCKPSLSAYNTIHTYNNSHSPLTVNSKLSMHRKVVMHHVTNLDLCRSQQRFLSIIKY